MSVTGLEVSLTDGDNDRDENVKLKKIKCAVNPPKYSPNYFLNVYSPNSDEKDSSPLDVISDVVGDDMRGSYKGKEKADSDDELVPESRNAKLRACGEDEEKPISRKGKEKAE